MRFWPSSARLAALGALACAPAQAAAPVTIHAGVRDGQPALSAEPGAGVRLNARVPPALELPDGRILRLTNGAITPDSAYYTEAPWTRRPASLPSTATLRVSYCRTDEALCRTVTLAVRPTNDDRMDVP